MNSDQAPVGVVCLCAAWCGVCRQYAPEFEALKARFPQVRFDWVDVDVETFPTLLIGQGSKALFLGPLLPQIKVLERLLTSLLAGESGGMAVSEEADALWQRVCKKWQ